MAKTPFLKDEKVILHILKEAFIVLCKYVCLDISFFGFISSYPNKRKDKKNMKYYEGKDCRKFAHTAKIWN